MNKCLNNLPRELSMIIRQVSKISAENRMPAYLVGGCLRDLILKTKNLDLDIAVEADGIFFAQKLAQKLKASIKIHNRFKTATLILTSGLKVDIATTRKEIYPYSAALPVVSSGSLYEDLKRRDFTINALALSLAKVKDKEIIDPYGGCADLALGYVRILHNLSFEDDPTRIFRAVRFSQRFNFKIEPKTFALLKQASALRLLDKVSDQRKREELILALKEKNPFSLIKQLGDLGALTFISPQLKISRSTKILFNSLDREIAWFVRNFPEHRMLKIWLVYFMGLLAPLTLSEVTRIVRRLSLTKIDQQQVASCYKLRKKTIAALSRKQITPNQIFLLLEPLGYEIIIFLRAISQNNNLLKHSQSFIKKYNGMRLCVNGCDLRSLGVVPGPEYRKIFTKVLAAKLNGQVKSRQTELALIRKLVKNK